MLSIAFFTAYVSIRTVPQSIYGQTRGKKKMAALSRLTSELSLTEPISSDKIGRNQCVAYYENVTFVEMSDICGEMNLSGLFCSFSP